MKLSAAFATVFAFITLLACSHSGSGGTSSSGPVPVVRAAPRNCATLNVSGNHTLEYCTKPSTATAPPKSVVYYFHGLGGSAEEMLEPAWAPFFTSLSSTLGESTPHVVSLSFGPAVALLPQSRGNFAPTPAQLLQEVIPAIEKQLSFTGTPSRIYLGLSLGGMNALNVAAADPTQVQALALLCPAVVNFDPFDPAQVTAFEQRNAAVLDLRFVNRGLKLALNLIGSPANWQVDNPMADLQNGAYDKLSIFLSAGQSDQFGFFEGATAFQTIATQKHINMTFAPVAGKHCSFDSDALLAFLKTNLSH